MEIKPTPAEEGIKAFALCPFFVPTKLVTDEYKGLSVEEAKLKVEQEIRKESMGQVPYSTFATILIHSRVIFTLVVGSQQLLVFFRCGFLKFQF